MGERGRLRASVLAFAVIASCTAPARAQDAAMPVPAALCETMRVRHVLGANPKVGCARLALVRFAYVGFDGATHDDGRLVVLDAVADEVLAIFRTLRTMRFPVRSARPMDEFDGDDDASMAANNTSAFNDRTVLGSTSPSVHAYGCAIDLNPVQNPYIDRRHGKADVAPPAGIDYVRRAPLRPGMAEAVVQVFARHGFSTWGGRWRSETDYQHFQVDRALAARLVAVSPTEAKRLFAAHAARGP